MGGQERSSRQQFLAAHSGRAISLAQLGGNSEALARLSAYSLSQELLCDGDLNQDGSVDALEAWQLIEAVDSFDELQDPRSVITAQTDEDADGEDAEETTAGRRKRGLDLLLQSETIAGAVAPENDRILYIGMNPTSTTELTALRQNADARVEAIQGASRQGQVYLNGEPLLLESTESIALFADSVVSEDKRAAVKTLLESESLESRDEIAQLIVYWSAVEKGEVTAPSRLVLSGHHIGQGVYGDDNGTLSWETLTTLTALFPRAAASVSDLLVAACNTAGPRSFNRYEQLFPRLQTIWAYAGLSPGAKNGATRHMRKWERATRADGTNVAHVAENYEDRLSENIRATDTATYGSIDDAQLSALLNYLEDNSQMYWEYYYGEREVEVSSRGPLRDYYTAIQQVLQQPNLDESDKFLYETQRDQAIRLLYFKRIALRFAETYSEEVATGYAAMSLSAPTYGTMSRQETLTALGEFFMACDEASNVPTAADDLREILYLYEQLDPALVPESWI